MIYFSYFSKSYFPTPGLCCSLTNIFDAVGIAWQSLLEKLLPSDVPPLAPGQLGKRKGFESKPKHSGGKTVSQTAICVGVELPSGARILNWRNELFIAKFPLLSRPARFCRSRMSNSTSGSRFSLSYCLTGGWNLKRVRRFSDADVVGELISCMIKLVA